MHSHTLAKGDIADYIIPGNRPTTLRYPNSHAVHSIYRDSHIPSRRPTWGHNARLQLALCNIRLGVLSALVSVSYTHLRAHRRTPISYAVFCLKKKKKKI